MSGLFSPKIPKAPEPVKPPTIDDTRQADEELMRLRRRRGRASTFLTSQKARRAASASLLTPLTPSTGPGTQNGGGRASIPSGPTGDRMLA
jgi:hypothetical protein